MPAIPILCYHNVALAPAASRLKLLYVSPAQFERQLWTIRRLGLQGVTVREGLRRLDSSAAQRSVILTFDDGYADTYTEALVLLRQYRFTATCYVVSDLIGSHNRWDDEYQTERKALMTRDQLQYWVEAGMEIGSHSCSHPWLNRLSAEDAYQEIAESRATLGRLLNTTVDHFCYPFGGCNSECAELVRRAGFHSAVTTRPGHARASDDRYRLPRHLVNGERGWWRFLLQAATPYDLLRHWRPLT
jgi:peptidoglycan/xylan/chitin deacetylase (PgdA/CDA1 family)